MVDDDLDLDLELDSEPEAPRKKRFGRRKPKPADASKAAAEEPAEDAPKQVAVVPAKKQGFFGRILAPVTDLLARIRVPQWNVRNFLIGLLALALVVVVVENWPAMRLNFIGLHADVPKAVVLILDFALGFVVAWLILRRRGAAATPDE